MQDDAECDLPPRTLLLQVLHALHACNLNPAIGGSALLVSLGYSTTVHDWDVTVDAPVSAVEHALAAGGIDFRSIGPSDIWCSDARFVVEDASATVDVIVGFRGRRGNDILPLPSRVERTWNELPMADAAVWAIAYEIRGDTNKAEYLRDISPSSDDFVPIDESNLT